MGKRIPAPHAWQVTLHRWWGAGEEDVKGEVSALKVTLSCSSGSLQT